MATDAPALRTLATPELAPQTTLVFGSLGAATLVAAYGLTTGTAELIVAGTVALTGPLVGLGHIDSRARELEAADV